MAAPNPQNLPWSSPSSSAFFFAPNLLMDQTSGLFHSTESGHQAQPKFWHLVALVCEAVLEVVCISSLGFVAAKRGLFSQKVQKDLAALNIYFFTPCLIFSKLAEQLTGDKLVELWIIPVILFVQTTVSWLAAELLTRLIKLKKKPQRNFVKAMAVFGNSNSLPLSLVISLSHTISGLHWDQIPNDNDKDVSARGILYLLVFSQLGQAVRWSWGMNSLLRPVDDYSPEERGEIPRDEEDQEVYKDDEDYDADSLHPATTPPASRVHSPLPGNRSWNNTSSGSSTPVEPPLIDVSSPPDAPNNPLEGHPGVQHRTSIKPSASERTESRSTSLLDHPDTKQPPTGILGKSSAWLAKCFRKLRTTCERICRAIADGASAFGHKIFSALPHTIQKYLRSTWFWVYITVTRFMGCINVPLAAIIASVLVGSIPSLREFFFTPGTFVNNTVTTAIKQMAGVAVPVILFVLGGNLCSSTLPDEDLDNPEYRREKRQMLWCSLACRMLIPLCIMGPFLAVLAKYTPISILDDPIFIIVCFLLTGAPSALQLAQICQVNDVFVPVISQLLVQSYVVWIFPSTLVLVMLALQVVKWAR